MILSLLDVPQSRKYIHPAASIRSDDIHISSVTLSLPPGGTRHVLDPKTIYISPDCIKIHCLSHGMDQRAHPGQLSQARSRGMGTRESD